MFGELISIKAAEIAAVLLVVFAAGWVTNGWRWDAKMQAFLSAQAKAVAEAKDRTRAQEQSIQTAANNIRNAKDAEIKIIRDQLDTALIELRKRPSRSSNVSGYARTATSATGAELYREDAEFLTREAARAQATLADYISCYNTYNEVRSVVSKKP
jgi:hypothetical protein